jgi:uncharacterized protein
MCLRSQSIDQTFTASAIMPGELSLNVLLSSLKVTSQPGTWAWATLPSTTLANLPAELLTSAQFIFAESEGLTVVLPTEIATAHGIPYTYPSKQITLDIHSSLEAVGFMAAISTRLAREGFSSNPVSAYYHDHLFVKIDEADRIVGVLRAMADEARTAETKTA